MSVSDRENRLMASFVGMLIDHQKDFEGHIVQQAGDDEFSRGFNQF